MAKPAKPGLLLLGVGTILTSMTVAGFLLGYLLDLWLDSSPVFMLILGFLGLLGGFMRAFKLLTHPDLNKN